MNAPARNFRHKPAIREATPLIIGLTAPSGGGKTKSALRLATGIVAVRGGKIVGIDTEANRMLHYAPAPGEKPDPARGTYSFEHIAFGAPFSSAAYREVLLYAAEQAAGGCVIVDSMSHEHEGSGGYLEYHESELDRMAGDNWEKRQKMTFTAWIKPAAERRKLINAFLQINCSFIFCFRAKEKIKPVRGGEPIQLGWQAIAGDEMVYEMTSRALLLPGAMGVPSWDKEAFAHNAAKLQEQHRAMFEDGKPLDEGTGEKLARWAAGTVASSSPATANTTPKSVYLSGPQLTKLRSDMAACDRLAEPSFIKVAKISSLEALPAADLPDAMAWLDARKKKFGVEK